MLCVYSWVNDLAGALAPIIQPDHGAVARPALEEVASDAIASMFGELRLELHGGGAIGHGDDEQGRIRVQPQGWKAVVNDVAHLLELVDDAAAVGGGAVGDDAEVGAADLEPVVFGKGGAGGQEGEQGGSEGSGKA